MTAFLTYRQPGPTTDQIHTANRLAREAIDARHIACTCGAWATVAPGWHERWCEREREEAREFERALARVQEVTT